ncbi:MAG: hypothetical protein R8G34_06065 [Paracoccaceae bacterium]|nr:hypothetical protein [Paracoccaceae bacterium]
MSEGQTFPVWMRWSLWIEASVFFVGTAAWFAIFFFPIIRFAASNEWVAKVWWIAVPCLWSLALLHVLMKYSFKEQYDAFTADRWKRKGWKGDPPRISETPAKSLAMFLGAVLVMRFLSVCILVMWVPMATTIFVRGPITHDFTVKALDERSKGPDVLEFEGNFKFTSGVPYPPDEIWNSASPGDTIRLSGTGNRWGVFYDEIELIN